MGVVLAPILPGKLAAWKQFVGEMSEGQSEDIKDFNRRCGLTRHAAWFVETPWPSRSRPPSGPCVDESMTKVGSSQHPFDE